MFKVDVYARHNFVEEKLGNLIEKNRLNFLNKRLGVQFNTQFGEDLISSWYTNKIMDFFVLIFLAHKFKMSLSVFSISHNVIRSSCWV